MLREGMKDYDDLALFRRKSGNAHFELRPVSDPSLSAGEAGDEALSRPPAQTTAPQGMLRQVVASPLNPPAQPALSLTTTAPEQARLLPDRAGARVNPHPQGV